MPFECCNKQHVSKIFPRKIRTIMKNIFKVEKSLLPSPTGFWRHMTHFHITSSSMISNADHHFDLAVLWHRQHRNPFWSWQWYFHWSDHLFTWLVSILAHRCWRCQQWQSDSDLAVFYTSSRSSHWEYFSTRQLTNTHFYLSETIKYSLSVYGNSE